MRQTYPTEAIALGRRSLAEESVLVTLLTREVGLVRARAQGLRKPGAKLASALQTLTESDITLVAGREGWRLSGALLRDNWFRTLGVRERMRASRVAALLLRLVPGESADPELYDIFVLFLRALRDSPEETHESVECMAVLRILAALGLDAGDLPGAREEPYGVEALRAIEAKRTVYIARANKGIVASGL